MFECPPGWKISEEGAGLMLVRCIWGSVFWAFYVVLGVCGEVSLGEVLRESWLCFSLHVADTIPAMRQLSKSRSEFSKSPTKACVQLHRAPSKVPELGSPELRVSQNRMCLRCALPSASVMRDRR